MRFRVRVRVREKDKTVRVKLVGRAVARPDGEAVQLVNSDGGGV